MPDALPPTPETGRCLCGAAYFFQRSGVIGLAGHFWCRRCGRRYRMAHGDAWEPFGACSSPVGACSSPAPESAR